MKKIIILLLLITCFSFLLACDPAPFYYNYEEMKNSVVAIELINYDNPEAKELFNNRDKVIPFDFSKVEVIETLKPEKIDDFLQEFSKLLFHFSWRHSDSPDGKCIKILYENGDFEIISVYVDYGYAGSFDINGNIRRFIGSSTSRTGIISIINKYFEAQI